MKKILSFLLKLFLGLLIVYFVLQKYDLGQVFNSLSQVGLGYFIFSLIFPFLILLLMTLKFRLFIFNIAKVGFYRLVLLYWVSDSLNLLSLGSITGEVYKMFAFKEKKKALTLSLYDRFLALVWYALLAFSMLIAYVVDKQFSFLFILVSSLLFALFVFLFVKIYPFIKNILLKKIKHGVVQKIFSVSEIHKRDMYAHALLSFVFIVVMGLSYAYIFYSVGLSVSWGLFALALMVVIFLNFPISIQGLGLREFCFVQYAIFFNLDTEKALAASFFVLMINIVYRVVGLLPFLFLRKQKY